jgi:hypothetical protein
MVRVLASVAMSVCAFILIAALLYGFKAAMVHFNDSWRKSVSSEGMEDASDNEGDIIMPEDDDLIVDIPDDEGEEADEQSENNSGEPGDAEEETGDKTDTLSEDEPDNAGDMEEEAGDTADPLPEEEPGKDGNTEEEAGNIAEPLPEEESGNVKDEKDVSKTEPPADNGANSSTAPFHSAFFDVDSNPSVKISIPYLVIRLHGIVNTINPADLTDVVLTRDGVTVSNGLRYTGTCKSFRVSNEDITDFYFAFEYDNVEPGKYGLKGKYQGEQFEVMEKIIEKPVSSEPAEAGALRKVEWWYRSDADYKAIEITELSFEFRGHQNAFYTSDITELKCYRNGDEIPLEFIYAPFRYYESDGKGSANTRFNLIIKNSFTQSGRYKVTGKYRGTYFETLEIMIP